MLAPGADDGGRAHPVVLHDVRAGEAEQAPDLLGHLLEHPARRGVAGHEGGDPAQRGLLVGEHVLGRLDAASARAARVRSAVTAASSSDVTAAIAMKSCVASRLSVTESRTNGPRSCDVFQTVIEQTMRSAVAAPRGPKRSAAQRSAGNTTYGTSRWGGSSASATSATSGAGLGELPATYVARAPGGPGEHGRRDDQHTGRVP